MQITPRQATILRAVVELHHASGRPVGSRAIVDGGVVDASPSTVRAELVQLQDLGLIATPHTSAGRVPTDEGYRLYVDTLVGQAVEPAGERMPALADDADARIEEALATTTQALAEATELLAVVTAPARRGALVRHVEVLQLSPTRIVAVVITSTGDVARHVVTTRHPVDPGLVSWAGQYLDEQVAGIVLGQHALRRRLRNPELGASEQAMLGLLEPAFTELEDESQEVHVGGSAGLLAQLGPDVQRVVSLVTMLDERRRLLEAIRPDATMGRLDPRVMVRIGEENPIPELHSLSVVGAAYGLGSRPLGMVGLIGPRAMDYALAMTAVRAAAHGLSMRAAELYAD